MSKCVNPENTFTETAVDLENTCTETAANLENPVTERASQKNHENNNNVPIVNPHAVNFPPECDQTFTYIKRESEENKEEVVNNSGVSTHKLWLYDSDNPAE